MPVDIFVILWYLERTATWNPCSWIGIVLALGVYAIFRPALPPGLAIYLASRWCEPVDPGPRVAAAAMAASATLMLLVTLQWLLK